MSVVVFDQKRIPTPLTRSQTVRGAAAIAADSNGLFGTSGGILGGFCRTLNALAGTITGLGVYATPVLTPHASGTKDTNDTEVFRQGQNGSSVADPLPTAIPADYLTPTGSYCTLFYNTVSGMHNFGVGIPQGSIFDPDNNGDPTLHFHMACLDMPSEAEVTIQGLDIPTGASAAELHVRQFGSGTDTYQDARVVLPCRGNFNGGAGFGLTRGVVTVSSSYAGETEGLEFTAGSNQSTGGGQGPLAIYSMVCEVPSVATGLQVSDCWARGGESISAMATDAWSDSLLTLKTWFEEITRFAREAGENDLWLPIQETSHDWDTVSATIAGETFDPKTIEGIKKARRYAMARYQAAWELTANHASGGKLFFDFWGKHPEFNTPESGQVAHYELVRQAVAEMVRNGETSNPAQQAGGADVPPENVRFVDTYAIDGYTAAFAADGSLYDGGSAPNSHLSKSGYDRHTDFILRALLSAEALSGGQSPRVSRDRLDLRRQRR